MPAAPTQAVLCAPAPGAARPRRRAGSDTSAAAAAPPPADPARLRRAVAAAVASCPQSAPVLAAASFAERAVLGASSRFRRSLTAAWGADPGVPSWAASLGAVSAWLSEQKSADASADREADTAHRWAASAAARAAQQRRRALFERAVSAPAGSVGPPTAACPAAWRLYLAFELSCGVARADAARRVFFRAINAVPWCKALWVDGLLGLGLSGALSARERSELLDVMREKEVRVRTDTFEVLLEEAAEEEEGEGEGDAAGGGGVASGGPPGGGGV